MGTAEFGKITVTLLSVENYVDYSIRCLSVTRVRIIFFTPPSQKCFVVFKEPFLEDVVTGISGRKP